MARVIRKATITDLPAILEVLEAGRRIMVESGNPNQWKPGYPDAGMVRADIEKEAGHVFDEDGCIVGYFAFIPSPDPTYSIIWQGAWLDDTLPYHVIHRIAKLPSAHGIFRDMIEYCAAIEPNLRIDTHRDNRIMQQNLAKHGFQFCGIIHIASGAERLAYQRIIR